MAFRVFAVPARTEKYNYIYLASKTLVPRNHWVLLFPFIVYLLCSFFSPSIFSSSAWAKSHVAATQSQKPIYNSWTVCWDVQKIKFECDCVVLNRISLPKTQALRLWQPFLSSRSHIPIHAWTNVGRANRMQIIAFRLWPVLHTMWFVVPFLPATKQKIKPGMSKVCGLRCTVRYNSNKMSYLNNHKWK